MTAPALSDYLVRPVDLPSIDPRDHGAKGDGVANDSLAIMAALNYAESLGGGTIHLRPGNYKANLPIGKATGQYANIKLTCDAHGSARIFSSDNHSPLIGAWYRSEISNIIFDAGLKGSPAANIHMVETRVRECIFDGWSGFGVRLNDGTYGDVGLLNLFAGNHVVQNTGVGIFQTYRWVDGWIIDNNVGSTEENISLEGGPVRVSGNHFNGSPTINIRLRGNKRVTIINNICEGALDEAIIYEMPSWLTSDDAQVLIANNNISNGGKRQADNTKQAIRIQGVAGTTGVSGFVISGNIIACEDEGSGWSHAVGLYNAHKVSLVGNNWEKGYSTAPFLVSAGSSAPKSSGNTSGNNLTVAEITTSNTPTATTFLRGDGSWVLPTNTTYSVMTETEATTGTATTARTITASALKGAIQRWVTGSYSVAVSTIGQALNRAADAAAARAAIGAAREDWTGTQSAYDALGTYEAGRTYNIVE